MFPLHAAHQLAIQDCIAGKLSPDGALQSIQRSVLALQLHQDCLLTGLTANSAPNGFDGDEPKRPPLPALADCYLHISELAQLRFLHLVKSQHCCWTVHIGTQLQHLFLHMVSEFHLDLQQGSEVYAIVCRCDDELDVRILRRGLLLVKGGRVLWVMTMDEVIIENVLFGPVEEVADYAGHSLGK